MVTNAKLQPRTKKMDGRTEKPRATFFIKLAAENSNIRPRILALGHEITFVYFLSWNKHSVYVIVPKLRGKKRVIDRMTQS